MSRLAASLTRSSFFAATLFVGASSARAQQVSACKSSYETAQELRAAGRLARSLRELDLCLNVCPRVLAADCQDWKDQLSPLVGLATIDLTSPDGDRTVSARIDGEPITLRTGASTVRLDPGEHLIEIAEAGFVQVSQPVTARAGATAEVHITLQRVGTSGAPIGPGGATEGDAGLPIFPFVLGGVGAAALTASAVLGIHGQVKAADLRDTCAKDGPFCPRARVDAIETEWQVGAVLASTGAAMLGVAIILYVIDAPGETSAPVQATASGVAISF